jgi:hypothetical protein
MVVRREVDRLPRHPNGFFEVLHLPCACISHFFLRHLHVRQPVLVRCANCLFVFSGSTGGCIFIESLVFVCSTLHGMHSPCTRGQTPGIDTTQLCFACAGPQTGDVRRSCSGSGGTICPMSATMLFSTAFQTGEKRVRDKVPIRNATSWALARFPPEIERLYAVSLRAKHKTSGPVLGCLQATTARYLTTRRSVHGLVQCLCACRPWSRAAP